MTFDANVPVALKKTQKWFASIITRRIDLNSRINPVSPRGVSIEEEARQLIKPSPTLRPAQRIELYNQQYWWRLLSVMQENFPFLARLFGYFEFNEAIGFPYLEKYPSDHWSLNLLGANLLRWIKTDYHASDKPLITIAATLDWAYCYSFSAPHHSPISLDTLPIPGDMESLLTIPLYLQPHIHLFKLQGDYLDLRFEMLKQPVEHWVDNDFPSLRKDKDNHYFILYRTLKTDLIWKEISEAEYGVLKKFQSGSSIGNCCDWLEKQRKKVYRTAEEEIHSWFREWIARQWLTTVRTS